MSLKCCFILQRILSFFIPRPVYILNISPHFLFLWHLFELLLRLNVPLFAVDILDHLWILFHLIYLVDLLSIWLCIFVHRKTPYPLLFFLLLLPRSIIIQRIWYEFILIHLVFFQLLPRHYFGFRVITILKLGVLGNHLLNRVNLVIFLKVSLKLDLMWLHLIFLPLQIFSLVSF